ncbi:MAG: aminotransferase class I/II-fold pyridoxal phosphate-dependent enzyme [Bacteroidetes bacterium]|nr:MAG: aminotransferase class I/II-fold pyridoxal phosphate-dependent enzyme [Bacteroidota bacterium]
MNLISDTVTKPTPAMLQAMMSAEVGDDVFGQDPTINALEAKLAKMFGKEAAVFCPSGTMTNQIAIKVHTQPLDEVLCEESSHIYQYEVGGYAYNSGIGINLIQGEYGKMTADQVEAAIKPVHDWLPLSKLVVLENTCNKGGGSYYSCEEVKPIRDLCIRQGMKLHLDGARIFNALTETKESTLQVGELFDSISVCLSKGLGAPVGSVLIGDEDFVRQARRVRKVMGGGMRQAGYLAAACIYALDNHVERLAEDHERAKKIGELLESMPYVKAVKPVHTNIVIFDLEGDLTAAKFLDVISAKGISAAPFGPQTVRFVTHLDYTEAMLEKTLEILSELKF